MLPLERVSMKGWTGFPAILRTRCAQFESFAHFICYPFCHLRDWFTSNVVIWSIFLYLALEMNLLAISQWFLCLSFFKFCAGINGVDMSATFSLQRAFVKPTLSWLHFI